MSASLVGSEMCIRDRCIAKQLGSGGVARRCLEHFFGRGYVGNEGWTTAQPAALNRQELPKLALSSSWRFQA
eukprot:14083400-Alexandrium_andersonii.AAC.1